MIKLGGVGVVLLGLLAGITPPSRAADLRIGLASMPTSMDPQYHVVGPNSAMARNLFDGLVNQDAHQQLRPALAVAWKIIDDTTWDFTLRPDVSFHDGSPLTADDVAASIARVRLAARNSPSSFVAYVSDIAAVEVTDKLAVRIRTNRAAPLLLNNLSRIAILPAALRDTPTSELNAGKSVIGTGPFKFVSWAPDDRLIVQANAAYWGGPPAWQRVEFRAIKSGAARVAAALAGDVDVIENIPPADVASLAAKPNLRVVSVPSNRVIYLHMDQARETSPFAAGPDGRNPLRNLAVRAALSRAINRAGLVQRVMDGQGELAGQLVPDGTFGHVATIGVDPFDPAQAKAMLAAAGYPQGFSLTLHAPNDRYPNDAQIAQAVGQMFSRVGIHAEVATLPGATYFSRASALEFSMILGGAAVETGEASGVLGPLLATFSPTAGQGNRGRYSSATFDAALGEALATVDPERREKLLQTAMEIAMRDHGVLPLFFLANSWAMAKSVSYPGRSDGYTLPAEMVSAP